MAKRNVKRQRRIWVTDEVTRTLKSEFSTTNASILNALKFASYSAEAKKIRNRAIALMVETQKSNEELMSEFN